MTRSEVSGGGPAVRSRYQQGATTQQSRLEMLQADFQQKLMREKEEKMVHVYEENQQRTLERLNNRQNNGSLNRGGSVREFFKERRALEAQNKGGVPPIHQHYSQYQNSPSGSAKTHYSMSSRMSGASHTSGQSSYSTGSNWSAPQPGYRNSAGRDRAKPLAPLTQKPGPPSPPIDKVNKHAPVPPIQQKPRIYQRKPGGPGNSDRDRNGNRIYRGQVYQGANSAQTNGSLGDYEDEDSSPSPPDQRKTGRRPANPARRPPGNNNPSSGSQSPQKLTDFQKWQLDQNQAREERLQRNKRQSSGSRVSDGMEADEDDSGIDLNDEIRRRKDEIQARLEQQQADLRRIQLQREQDEEKERQKRARKERAQQDRHRRMEEQRERQRAAEEERQRLQQERRQAQEERRHAEERQHMEAEERQSRHSQGTYRHPDEDSMYAPSPRSQQPQRRTQPNKPRRAVHHERRQSLRAAANASRPDPEEELIPVPGPGIDIYAQAANDTEAFGPSVDLAPCKVCGRRFARDRLPKHQQACKTVAKPRKVFDPVKMRTEGTEAAQYVRSNRHQKQSESRKPKKSNWRAQHESFIQSIRYAKKMSDYEANGGKLSDLPPPPPSDTSDYVQCPHCNRRFNQSVAERHIPKCVNIRAKPRPPPNRRR